MFFSRKGFTLIELMLTIIVIVIISVTTFVIYKKTQSANNAQEEVGNINTIRESIQTVYNSKVNFEGLDNNLGLSLNIFPSKMIVDNNGIKSVFNIFSGSVSISPSSISPTGEKNSSFAITYEKIPDNECVKMITSLSSMFYNIEVAGKTVKENSDSSGLNIDSLTKACDHGIVDVVFIGT